MTPFLHSAARCSAIAGLVLATGSLRAAPSYDNVVINARVFNGYHRTQLPDGSFKPEHYGVADGGRWDGTMVDRSIDGMSFDNILQTIARPLSAQGYLPATDPKKTDLLILVFWGTTNGAHDGQYDHGLDALQEAMLAVSQTPVASDPLLGGAQNGPAMSADDQRTDSVQNRLAMAADDQLTTAMMLQNLENRSRVQNNIKNARILGYADAYARARALRDLGLSAGDLAISELEEDRYFVVLKAYDFQYALRHRKLKLLWDARFSTYERGNRFDEQLAPMARAAARYFGRNTDGLVRRSVPEGTVEVGTPTVVEPAAVAVPSSDAKR